MKFKLNLRRIEGNELHARARAPKGRAQKH
jgi:hypothetical protein